MASWSLPLLGLVACGEHAPPVDEGIPEGSWLSLSSSAQPLLEDLAARPDTPAGSWAIEVLALGCDNAVAQEEGGFPETATCDTDDPLGTHRADHAAAFALPALDGRVVGTLSVSPQRYLVEAALDLPEDPGPIGALFASDESPGLGVLSQQGAIVSGRVRARGGLPIGSWIEGSEQADQLFALQSDLFGAAVLEGTWEVAVYAPAPGTLFPQMALALGVRSEKAGEAAMEGFIEALGERWPVHRTPLSDGRGACLRDLNILPGFAPCYELRGGHLVVGWNEASLAQAGEGEVSSRPSGLIVDFEEMARADRMLEELLTLDPAPPWPWKRLTLSAVGDGRATLRAELERR